MNLCPGCNLEMKDGQVFNGLLKCHWDCQDAVRAKIGDDMADRMVALASEVALARQGIVRGHPLFEKLMRARAK